MSNFAVIVLCAAHMANCPIPNGYHTQAKVANQRECIKEAKGIIASLGYAAADFSISCKEK